MPIHEEEKVHRIQGMDALILLSLIPNIGSGWKNLIANPKGTLHRDANILRGGAQGVTTGNRAKSGTRMPRFTHSRRNS
jgi:hypothetical protein